MICLIGYEKCSTCQKARAWLKKQGIAYTFRPIREQPPTREELLAWQKKSGLPLTRFFNTSGGSYRALGLKDTLKSKTEDEQLALLSADGMLVKRPLLVAENCVLVGFREEEWTRALSR